MSKCLGKYGRFLGDQRLVKAARLAKCSPEEFLRRLLRNGGITA